ncbi:MAG: hypothetical protein QOH61_261, partial [Chloroflexota bacterium]|nr:hypothetical protein [Chloroflexota bacterium]
NLDTNTGSTITFSGGLSVSTLANVGFNAIGGGTVNVCDENPCTTGGAVVNTLNSTSASALNVTGTTIGAEGLTFRSISAGNATAAADPAAGILLNSTGSGGLTVTGIGTTAGSGGTIQNITNRGASFTSAQNITLKNMNFTLVGTVNGADPTVSSGSCGAMDTGGGGNLGCAAGIHLATVTGVTLDRLVMNNDSDPTAGVTSSGQQGINGNNVTTFALTNSQVLNFGNEAGEDGLHFRDIKGTSAITATTVSGSERDQVRVLNGSGTTVTLTVSGGSTFSTSAIPNGGMGIEFEGEGSAAMTIDVQTGTTFSGLRSIGLQALGKANVQMDVKVNASTFLNTGSAGIDIATKDSGDTRFNVTGNGMTNQAATAINIDIGGSPTGTQNATLQGNVSGNTISTTSGSGAIGISLDANGGQVGQGGVLTATVTGNDVTINGGANGIVAIVGDGSPTLNATIKNNTMHSASGGDMFLESSKISTDTSTACMEVSGNNVPNNTSDDVQLSQRFSSTFKMRGFPGGDIGVYFASQNTLNGGTVLFEGTFVNTAGGAACPQPTLP